MKKHSKRKSLAGTKKPLANYDVILSEIVDLLESARRASARAINAIITATYWEVGRRIVELEQGGRKKADYGERLVDQLSKDWPGNSAEDLADATCFRCAPSI